MGTIRKTDTDANAERAAQEAAGSAPTQPAGRVISEIAAELKRRGSTAMMDDGFAQDIEEGVKAQRLPWNPPSWD